MAAKATVARAELREESWHCCNAIEINYASVGERPGRWSWAVSWRACDSLVAPPVTSARASRAVSWSASQTSRLPHVLTIEGSPRFVAGDVQLLKNGLSVSVVGTREPSSEGIERTKALVLELASLVRRGITVVSGLAKGVGAVAHSTAMDPRGRTIAVLGTPLDVAYPAENRPLQQRIVRVHLAVSQFPAGMRAGAKAFPIRNRTMALVSDATVIVEAGEGGGTVHQGWEALRLGRPLFLMESLVARSHLAWPAEMLGFGAERRGPESQEP